MEYPNTNISKKEMAEFLSDKKHIVALKQIEKVCPLANELMVIEKNKSWSLAYDNRPNETIVFYFVDDEQSNTSKISKICLYFCGGCHIELKEDGEHTITTNQFIRKAMKIYKTLK